MGESKEEYLEAIYSYNEKGQPAKNQDLSERLGISPPSVTQMIQKLAEENLVTYEPYKGVLLTGKGTAEAQRIVRKHRLLERFLHDNLGMDNKKVHAEACRMEHSLGDEVEAAICNSLKNPSTCPDDGKPIPECTLEVESCTQCKAARESVEGPRKLLTQLSNLRACEEGRVAFSRGAGNASQRIMDMGLSRGAAVKVVKAAPFHGPLEVQVRGTLLVLGRELAEKIFVEVEPAEKEVRHRPQSILAK
jgi:DtxR family transcriptional regulator, Mn-dependent transcriptional regulator